MKKIVYTRPDGGVSIVHPAPNARGALRIGDSDTLRMETDDEFVERIRQKDVPKDATNVLILDEAEVPVDRTFRNAWRADLTVDMAQAREIHREHLRRMRAPILEGLDVEYQEADERGDLLEKQRIATQKQALRDVTADPMIEAARTPEELKVAIPMVLHTETERTP